MTAGSTFGELTAAADRGDHDGVVRLATNILADLPGNDAAHALRARAYLALGHLADAEADAQAAVRLDPDEVRYRELLAETLSATGAHREAAEEYARLARLDPRQAAWTRAEAIERLAAAESEEAVEAARRALRLDPADAAAQLTLTRGLLRIGQATLALEAAERSVALSPNDGTAREALADAQWLAGDEAAALAGYAALARDPDRELAGNAVDKGRSLYRSRAGIGGRLLAAVRPLFAVALRAGRLQLPAPAAVGGGSEPRPPGRGPG
ncbi:MAG TPA: tetratricopeptide repeat protein [Candidatus Limnocylindria bacterium]|nr:tetratricopeptide repeat protein [Candidatus Limnocylindria bacterium]